MQKYGLTVSIVGEWPYGYTSFRLDLTPYILTGKENIIAVRLDTKNWDSRWYPGAGLYRNVWLVKTSQLHISNNGVFCTTPEIRKERGMLSVQAEVESHLNESQPVTVKAIVYKLNDKFEPLLHRLQNRSSILPLIPAVKTHEFRLDIPVKNPVLWDIKKSRTIPCSGHCDAGYNCNRQV